VYLLTKFEIVFF